MSSQFDILSRIERLKESSPIMLSRVFAYEGEVIKDDAKTLHDMLANF